MPWTHPTEKPYHVSGVGFNRDARCHNCGFIAGGHYYPPGNPQEATECHLDGGNKYPNQKDSAEAREFLESLKEDQKMIVEFEGYTPLIESRWGTWHSMTVGKQYEVFRISTEYDEDRRISGSFNTSPECYKIIDDNGKTWYYPIECFKIIKQGKVNKVTTINWNKVYKYLEIKSEEFNKLNFVKEEAQDLIPDPEKRKRLEILRSSGLAQGNYLVKLISSMDGINYDLYLKPQSSAYIKPVKGAAFVVDKNVNGHDYPLKVVTICSEKAAGLYSIDVIGKSHGSYNLYDKEIRAATKKDISCVTEGQLEAAIKAGYLNMTDINKVELKPKKISKAEKPTEEVKAAIAA